MGIKGKVWPNILRTSVFKSNFFLQLHLDEGVEIVSEDANEPDFFKQHENSDLLQNEMIIPTEEKAFLTPITVPSNDSTKESTPEVASNSLGPSVKLFDSTSNNLQSERKPTIGCRTAQSKRPGGVSS